MYGTRAGAYRSASFDIQARLCSDEKSAGGTVDGHSNGCTRPLQCQDQRRARIVEMGCRRSEKVPHKSQRGEAGASPDAESVSLYVT